MSDKLGMFSKGFRLFSASVQCRLTADSCDAANQDITVFTTATQMIHGDPHVVISESMEILPNSVL